MEPFKGQWSPGALYVCVRPEITGPGWVLKVYNFATWRHKTVIYATEAEARTAAGWWLI
jgi:hypothetical protein